MAANKPCYAKNYKKGIRMKKIAGTELEIFALNLGTNSFGWTADKEEAFGILDAFVDGGGNFVDTADSYSSWATGNKGGESETIIGEWLASRGKDKLVVATKSGDLPPFNGRSRKNVFAAVENSLKRLGVEAIDLFYYHRDDQSVGIEEQVAIASDLIKEGKIRYLALSNYSPERLREFYETARGTAAHPVAIQPEYNLLYRREFEEFYGPMAAEFNSATFPYYALASGVLTGKYRSKEDAKGRARQGSVQALLTDDALKVIDTLVKVAERRDSTPTTVALAWQLAKGVTAPIASVSRAEQLPELLAAPRLELDETDVKELDQVSASY